LSAVGSSSSGSGSGFSTSKAKLLNDPNPNSIGNFFENKTEDTSFIQCYMLALGEVQGIQYGVGFPIDMPVMLTYFEDNELKPVRNDFEDFDHLVNHVSVQLENNDLYLYNTPVVLTLQGEFEDETMNDAYTPRGKTSRRTQSGGAFGTMEINEEEDEEEEEEEEEVTVEEVIALEGLDNEDSYDDDEDDEEFLDEGEEDEEDDDEEDNDEDNVGSFWNSSPAGKNNQLKDIPDFSVYRPEKPDTSDIPADAFVTDEDTKSLRRAHRKADKIIQYAADIKLIASFHYKKKNYHLVKLLEVCIYLYSESSC